MSRPTVRLGIVLRKLRALGCTVNPTRGGHYKATRVVNGRRCVSSFPTVGGRKVEDCYVRQNRDRLRITPEEWDAA